MKHKKLLGYGSIGLTLISLGVAFIGPFNTSTALLRARATNVTGGQIEFDRSNATKSGTTNSTPGITNTGGAVICKTFNNDATQSSGYVGAVKSGSTIKFFESDGTTEYTFEDLSYISFDHTGTAFGFNLTGIYDDGEEFSFSYSAKTTHPRGINFANYGNVAHLRIDVTSDIVTLLTSITITYNCTAKYLSGIEVNSSPTKTTYSAGESFDPTGMVIKAVYSNNLKVVTQAYTYSPSGALSSSDTAITINYKGFTSSIPITVEELANVTGVYVCDQSSAITIDFDNLTYTHSTYGETVHFTFVQSGDSLVFTYVSGDNTNFGNYRMFDGGASPVANSTGKVTSDTKIGFKTYSPFGSGYNRTFTKQS